MKAALLAIAAGCGFSSSSSGGGDDTGLCPFPLDAEYVDVCKTSFPSHLDQLPDVTITGAAQIDTGNGQITGPGIPTSPPSTMAEGVRIVWTKSFTISSAGSLRAYGLHPLVIVATGEISIGGLVDGSSNMYASGPGASPPACTERAAKAGDTCAQHGGSGGGGGGFGAAGGAGGEGGDTHDCGGAVDGKPGGAGGMALGARPTELRGGCAGARGAPTNAATSTGGVAGAGGGAIAFIAREKMTVLSTGKIHVGGAAGLSGKDRAGGGGGGSGGMIFIEAPDIDLQASSVLAANGGGGAAGTDNSTTGPAEDAWPSTEDANGGTPDPNGGTGGNGGVILSEEGRLGGLATRGGGGGGGGVGVIRLHEMTSMRSGITTPAIAN